MSGNEPFSPSRIDWFRFVEPGQDMVEQLTIHDITPHLHDYVVAVRFGGTIRLRTGDFLLFLVGLIHALPSVLLTPCDLNHGMNV